VADCMFMAVRGDALHVLGRCRPRSVGGAVDEM
jgi:hypothetical protein